MAAIELVTITFFTPCFKQASSTAFVPSTAGLMSSSSCFGS